MKYKLYIKPSTSSVKEKLLKSLFTNNYKRAAANGAAAPGNMSGSLCIINMCWYIDVHKKQNVGPGAVWFRGCVGGGGGLRCDVI